MVAEELLVEHDDLGYPKSIDVSFSGYGKVSVLKIARVAMQGFDDVARRPFVAESTTKISGR